MEERRLQQMFTAPVLALGLFGFLTTGDGNAATQARIGLGAGLAKTWCASCHAVAPDETEPVQADVPTFEAIANRDGMSAEKLKVFLQSPHPPMPNLDLSREDIENVARYIMSLKDKKAD